MTTRRFSRRDFLKATVLAAGGVGLAACQPVNSAAPVAPIAKGKIELKFLNELVGSKEEGRTYLLGAFNAASDQSHVNHDGYNGSEAVHEKFMASLTSGETSDLYHNEANYIPAYAEMDALTDLGPYLGASSRVSKDDLLPHPLNLCTYKGSIYGIPIYQDAIQLYYNKDLMQAAGLDPNKPPRDWASLKEAAEAIVKRDSNGKLLVAGLVLDGWSIRRVFQDALYSWGGTLLSADGLKAAFNSPEGEAALQTLVDLILVHKLGEDNWGGDLEDTPEEPFVAGKQGFKFDVPAAAKRIQRNNPSFTNWGITSVPAGPKGFAVVSRPPALMIPKASKNKDQAWRFIEYWLDSLVMTRWSLDILRAPTTISASSNQALEKSPVIKTLVESLKQTVDTPKTKHWPELFETVGLELDEALAGKKSPADALNAAAVTLNKILAS